MSKILLVEDDKDTNEIYRLVLTKQGYNVTSAEDGEKGLSLAKEGGWDLILLDIMMPKIDGLTLLTELKKNPPKTSNGPIIILTNLSHDKVTKDAIELGAKDCVVKSDITPGQLVEKIKKWLE